MESASGIYSTDKYKWNNVKNGEIRRKFRYLFLIVENPIKEIVKYLVDNGFAYQIRK